MKRVLLSGMVLLAMACTKEVEVEVIREVLVEDTTRINSLTAQIAELEGHLSEANMNVTQLQEDLETANSIVADLTTWLYESDEYSTALLDRYERSLRVQNILASRLLINDPDFLFNGEFVIYDPVFEELNDGSVAATHVFGYPSKDLAIWTERVVPEDTDDPSYFTTVVIRYNGDLVESFDGVENDGVYYTNTQSYIKSILDAKNFILNY